MAGPSSAFEIAGVRVDSSRRSPATIDAADPMSFEPVWYWHRAGELLVNRC
jgi:hypothetical protein